jgi:hypothetical protein
VTGRPRAIWDNVEERFLIDLPWALMSPRSNSSLTDAGLLQKCREAVTFIRWRLNDPKSPLDFNWIFDCIDGYRSGYEQFTRRPFANARTLEIGYGARPLRLIALISMGIDARGIDLDTPMLRLSPVQLGRVIFKNGSERALKTACRSILFDGRERVLLRMSLRQRGFEMRIDPNRFLVGDAAEFDFGSEPLDLIYSEDAFEHFPPAALEKLMARLAQNLSPQGLAFVTPNIFTGITGGHLPEWYSHRLPEDFDRKSEPWEHLRKRRYAANTYLNGLPRCAYRELFGRYFDILEERVVAPELGRRWLTAEVKAELSQWDEEELFSNKVQFVLRPKTATRCNTVDARAES